MSAIAADRFPIGDIEKMEGSLSQRVYTALREAILSLACPPGTILRKGPISEQLGVSRAPISEAIARLSAEGLVDVIPQSATRVSCFSMDDIRESTFLREAIELAAVEMVAAHATDEQITQIQRNIRLQQLLIEDNDFQGFYEADEEFHAMIMEFTGFAGAVSTARAVSLQLKRARMLLLPEEGRAAETVREHQAVLDAIRARNPDQARAAMKSHLGQLISRIEPLEEKYAQYFVSR